MTSHSHNLTGSPEPNQGDELWVTFANTLAYSRGQPQERLPDVDALLVWLHDQRLISDRARSTEAASLHRDTAESARRLERFRHLRQVLRTIADEVVAEGRPGVAALRDLNHILRHGLHYHQLEANPDRTRYSLAQVGDRLDQARATIASSLARFLADDDPHRLRVCANDGCRWVFIDRSPTGRRRWCDMRTCGNQAKVARHRARSRAAQPDDGVPEPAASV